MTVTTSQALAKDETTGENGERYSTGASSFFFFLFRPVDIAPLVFFRIVFGILMLLEVGGYMAAGLVRSNWVQIETNFSYFGFGWVPALGAWTYALVAVCLIAAIGITLGAWYRLSAVTFAFAFGWFYLIEQSNYMNHFYLICLLAWVMAALPANRSLSFDVARRPDKLASSVPAWTLVLLQVHIAIAYFFGGIAKINGDWLRGEPVRTWLHEGSMGRQISPLFHNEVTVYALSYGGLLFDLLVVPCLLWKRTRKLALVAAAAFHLSNAYLFNIGVFPFLSIAMTLLFLPPHSFRKVLRLGGNGQPSRHIRWGTPQFVLPLVGVYLAYHLLMPFRHWLYPGNVHWTEEGHRYSWHMMLRSKDANAYFIVEDKMTGALWRIRPEIHLSRRQFRKMSVHPEMLLQFAHYIRSHWRHDGIAVYAVSYVKLNDHEPALLVNPEVDLSREKLGFGPSKWILPFGNDRALPAKFRWVKDLPARFTTDLY